MSENGEIYTAGKKFTLPLAVTAVTNLTSVPGSSWGLLGASCNTFLRTADLVFVIFSLQIWFVIFVTNIRSAHRFLVGAPWGLVQHFSQDCLGFLSPQVPRCVFPCHFLAQKGIKRELFWHHDLNIRGPCMWLECWIIICAGEFAVKAPHQGYVYCLNGICLGCASVNIKINIYSTLVQEI